MCLPTKSAYNYRETTQQLKKVLQNGWLVQCCFTSTETVGLSGTRAQDGHLDFHTAPESMLVKSYMLPVLNNTGMFFVYLFCFVFCLFVFNVFHGTWVCARPIVRIWCLKCTDDVCTERKQTEIVIFIYLRHMCLPQTRNHIIIRAIKWH